MRWTLEITLNVSDNWVADGFDAAECVDRIREILRTGLLPYAYEHEMGVDVRLTRVPRREAILALQGYGRDVE